MGEVERIIREREREREREEDHKEEFKGLLISVGIVAVLGVVVGGGLWFDERKTMAEFDSFCLERGVTKEQGLELVRVIQDEINQKTGEIHEIKREAKAGIFKKEAEQRALRSQSPSVLRDLNTVERKISKDMKYDPKDNVLTVKQPTDLEKGR